MHKTVREFLYILCIANCNLCMKIVNSCESALQSKKNMVWYCQLRKAPFLKAEAHGAVRVPPKKKKEETKKC